MSEIFSEWGIAALSRSLKEKKISAREAAEHFLREIETRKSLNAYITVTGDRALSDADKAQKRLNAGSAAPLTGIPLAIKDNICTEGIRTTCASRMLEDFIPPYTATAVLKLEEQNTVLLGKTNMDEFAMGGSSQTSYFGGVKNPRDETRVPGGSSGGSAAAVAADLCAGSLGSDTGGSIRQPAAFCGVTGLKPTYGAVSRYGLVAFASSLDQIGPVARSAEDCALLYDAVRGFDENDQTSKKTDKSALCRFGMTLKGVKIGLPREFFEGVDDDVKNAVLAAANELQRLGCELCEVSLPGLKYAVSSYYLISSAEAASNLSRYDGIKYGHRSEIGDTYEELIANSRREGFGSEVKRRIMLGNYALSSGYYDAYYAKAVSVRAKIKEEYDAILSGCDCILTPTAPTVAYHIGEQENDPVKMYSADICTVTVNIAGLPAVSLNCGEGEGGMPVGMSIIGRPFDESFILAVADRYQREIG